MRRSPSYAPARPIAVAPAPPAWRDPWAWAACASILPILFASIGAPFAEPVADDFEPMARVLLGEGVDWLSGFGSAFYWRPLSRQAYYLAAAGLIAEAPRGVMALHALALAATAFLIHRALRPAWGGPLAAAAATGPVLLESSRMLIGWPANMQDLGAILFAALAIHEASRRRLATTLAALVGSLLCKEVVAPAAPLIALMPGLGPRGRAARLRWLAAVVATLAAWAAAYLAVHAAAGLTWPGAAVGAATPGWPARVGWSAAMLARATVGLEPAPGRWDAAMAAALVGLVAAAAVVAIRPAPRRRLAAARGWATWGAAWFAAAAVLLAPLHPEWYAYRAAFGALGVSIAAVALLGAASPWLAAGFVALRLATVAVAPPPPPRVDAAPVASGAAFDVPRLARLQRFVSEVREALRRRHPTLPRGARVVQHHLPQMSEYAFAGSRALQVWYRDPTLAWMRFEEFRARPGLGVAAIVEYQPDRAPQVAVVEPEAMRALIAGLDAVRGARWREALDHLARAERLQPDTSAAVFRASVLSKRAAAEAGLGRDLDAERSASRAIGLWPDDTDARWVLATRLARRGRLREASAQLETLLTANPRDAEAGALLERVHDEMEQAAQ